MEKYFTNPRSFYHGIMFHHFHDNRKYNKAQGSISKNEFIKIINLIGKKNIINADIFIKKLKANTLKKNEVCLTFDDGLKCQFDVIHPVLKKLKIKAFFFIYTSIFEKKPDLLEVFRYFRTTYFKKIDDFYKYFFNFCSSKNIDLSSIIKNEKKAILKKKYIFPFYTYNDILFRIIRDKYLKRNQYEKIMINLMKNKNFNYKGTFNKLFLSAKELKELASFGHNIGLHSHTHPTTMSKLPKQKQKFEFTKNNKILTKNIKSKINSMSHPCGSYNLNTKKILNDLDIEIGFRSNMKKSQNSKIINNSKFEIAREDHANILNLIKKNV
mgnify:FL=1